MTDKKILRSITVITLTVLLIAMLVPGESTGRLLSAPLLLLLAPLTAILVKKRAVLSIDKSSVLFLCLGFGAVYLLLYYLTGLYFGFSKNPYLFNPSNFLSFILPITVTIIATEIIRAVAVCQKDKICDAICYASCILAEVLICGNIHYVISFNRFMDLVGLTLIPAVISNLLYHYISRRYGAFPNIVFRLMSTLYLYVIPYVPAMSDSLFALYNMVIPVVIYSFISALYGKKRRYAVKKRNRAGKILTAAVVALMIGTVMLISNQFRYGIFVIATPSMTGELNVGDAAIFEKYDDQNIVEGQVIVFERDGSMVVHRVVNIEKINGVIRYYTKGDANFDNDEGYVVTSQIVGLVNFKIPYVGYPTLWLRSLFHV